jgi:inhibitor of cysteine peptidase
MGGVSIEDPVKIRLKDQSSAISLPVGKEVQIELDENPTTGYRWELSAEPKRAVDVVSNSYSRRTSGIGAGGSRVWLIKLVEPAKVHLRAFLRQPWQPTEAPYDSASLDLFVK